MKRELYLMLAAVVLLTSCAANITITPTYQPETMSGDLLGAVPSTLIRLGRFEDRRPSNPEAVLIGRREAFDGMPMGDVFSASPVFDVIRNAIQAELTTHGHNVVSGDEQILITGEIQSFWVGTDVTAVYWDVIGDVSFSVEITDPDAHTSIKLGPYHGGNTERTYINPGKEMIARVVQKSTTEAVQSMISDPAFIAGITR